MSTLSADLSSLSREAYIYLYPLVTMDISRRQAINVPAGQRPAYGPPNKFHHLRAFPPADFRAVVRVNFDTLYTPTWLDLTAGPVTPEQTAQIEAGAEIAKKDIQKATATGSPISVCCHASA